MGHTSCMRKRGSDFMGKAVYVLYSVILVFEPWLKMPGKLIRKE